MHVPTTKMSFDFSAALVDFCQMNGIFFFKVKWWKSKRDTPIYFVKILINLHLNPCFKSIWLSLLTLIYQLKYKWKNSSDKIGDVFVFTIVINQFHCMPISTTLFSYWNEQNEIIFNDMCTVLLFSLSKLNIPAIKYTTTFYMWYSYHTKNTQIYTKDRHIFLVILLNDAMLWIFFFLLD